MKYFLLFATSILFSLITSANTDDNIKALVNKWNSLHNTQNKLDLVDFLDLYAPQVLFYSKNYTDEECYFVKEKLFKSGFSQQIISPIVITHYNSGTIKAEFTKRTKSGKKIKEHLCYLLFKEFNGRYRITGESDNLTDQNKNVTLNVGEPITKSDDSNLYKSFLLFAIAVTLAAGYLYKKNKNKFRNYTHTESLIQNTQKNSDNLEAKPRRKAPYKTYNTNQETYTKQKGDDFEKYIVERFDKPCFTLTEWRSGKIHKGVYAASNRLPDLEYHFKTNYADCHFAVECKWRKSFIESKIQWAKGYQLENYRRFSEERKIPVFVIIGIGGQPNQPQALYIVPLHNISFTDLHEHDLKPYYRYSRSDFYFDAGNSSLS